MVRAAILCLLLASCRGGFPEPVKAGALLSFDYLHLLCPAIVSALPGTPSLRVSRDSANTGGSISVLSGGLAPDIHISRVAASVVWEAAGQLLYLQHLSENCPSGLACWNGKDCTPSAISGSPVGSRICSSLARPPHFPACGSPCRAPGASSSPSSSGQCRDIRFAMDVTRRDADGRRRPGLGIKLKTCSPYRQGRLGLYPEGDCAGLRGGV